MFALILNLRQADVGAASLQTMAVNAHKVEHLSLCKWQPLHDLDFGAQVPWERRCRIWLPSTGCKPAATSRLCSLAQLRCDTYSCNGLAWHTSCKLCPGQI